MTTATLDVHDARANTPLSLWKRCLQWVDRWPPLLAPAQVSYPEPSAADGDGGDETPVVVHTDAIAFWLLTKLPVWEEISREEAAQYILQREVRVRYQPLIVEMDRKTILNEVK